MEVTYLDQRAYDDREAGRNKEKHSVSHVPGLGVTVCIVLVLRLP